MKLCCQDVACAGGPGLGPNLGKSRGESDTMAAFSKMEGCTHFVVCKYVRVASSTKPRDGVEYTGGRCEGEVLEEEWNAGMVLKAAFS